MARKLPYEATVLVVTILRKSMRPRLTALSLSPPTEKRIEHSQRQDGRSLGTLSCVAQGHKKRSPDGRPVSGARAVLPT